MKNGIKTDYLVIDDLIFATGSQFGQKKRGVIYPLFKFLLNYS